MKKKSRVKSEKFGILDSPALFGEDVRASTGPLGSAVLYLDIDDFKKLNTRFNETVVDEHLLPTFQSLVESWANPHGYAYAEGGDEIVILFRNTSGEMASYLADMLRHEINRTDFSISKTSSDRLKLSVSLGLAASRDGIAIDELRAEANAAKAKAKTAGKNRLAVATRAGEYRVYEPETHFSISDSRAAQLTTYLAAPHRNTRPNGEVSRALSTYGIRMILPRDYVQEHVSGSNSEEAVRRLCREAIEKSQAIVVDLQRYGLDSAWEIGFAEGMGKPIIGWLDDAQLGRDKRVLNRREYIENFMHGWNEHHIHHSSIALAAAVSGKKVYVIGSFRNSPMIAALKECSTQHRLDMVFPHDLMPPKATYGSTDRALQQDYMRRADIAVVMLPRYGMDSAWQIGFAEGIGMPVCGAYFPEIGDVVPPEEFSSFQDHWMHGWTEKQICIDSFSLAAFLRGGQMVGLIPADPLPTR